LSILATPEGIADRSNAPQFENAHLRMARGADPLATATYFTSLQRLKAKSPMSVTIDGKSNRPSTQLRNAATSMVDAEVDVKETDLGPVHREAADFAIFSTPGGSSRSKDAQFRNARSPPVRMGCGSGT
jgi:hypothetical protein